MLNKVQLIGNLGKSPDVRTLDNGNKVANFSIATSESYKDKQGQKQTVTEWHNVVIWGKTADIAEKYLSKGSRVYIEGKLKTRSWEDKDGNKKYTTEVVLEQYGGTLKMLSTKEELVGVAQIEIPLSNRSADIYLNDTNIVITTIPANTGQIDSFGFVSTRFPTFIADGGFVTYDQVDNAWSNRQFKNAEYIVGNKVYKPESRRYFAALRNRKAIALIQKVRVYTPQMAEKTNDEKFWYLYQYMIDNNINNDVFWNSQQVIDLITPIIPPIDTTPQDTIQ